MTPRDQDTPDDITELLRRAEASRMNSESKDVMRDLSSAWERIQQAHDHTTAATVLLERGFEREYVMLTIADLAAVRDAAQEQIRIASRYAVNTLNVAGATVAIQAGVSQSTVSRWSGKEID